MSSTQSDEPTQRVLLPELAACEPTRDIRSDLAERSQAAETFCPEAHDREATALSAASPVAIRLGLKNVAGHRSTSLTSRMLRGQSQGFELTDIARWDVEAAEEERRNGATKKRELIAVILGGLLPEWEIRYLGKPSRTMRENVATMQEKSVDASSAVMLGRSENDILSKLEDALQAGSAAVVAIRQRRKLTAPFIRAVDSKDEA